LHWQIERQKVGATNVEFRKGELELPVESSVDVIISNCVINLSPDKERFQEAFRVLKPGGVGILGHRRIPMPDAIKYDLVVACASGAITDKDYLKKMRLAVHDVVIARRESARSVYSAKIIARKPGDPAMFRDGEKTEASNGRTVLWMSRRIKFRARTQP
jgi:SAM-dependent methyltransferase